MKSSAATKHSKTAKAVQHLTAQYKGIGLQAAAQQEANHLATSGGILYNEYAISIPEVSLTTGTAAISLQIQVSLTAGICQMDKSFHGVLMLDDLPDGTVAELEQSIAAYISREISRASNWVILRLGLPPVLWASTGRASTPNTTPGLQRRSGGISPSASSRTETSSRPGPTSPSEP